MPRSRKRQGHHEYRKPSDIPASQRTKGRILMAVLFGVFGLLIGFFAFGGNYIALVLITLVGVIFGFAAGKNMERQARDKD